MKNNILVQDPSHIRKPEMEAVLSIGVLLFLQSVTRNNKKYYNGNMIISRLNCI